MSSISGVGGLFTGFTRLSKALSFVLLIGYIVTYLVPSTTKFVALVPGKTIPFAWNLLSAGFIEQNLIGLVISIVALLFLGKALEPVWGSKEFFWFVLVVNTWTTIITFSVMIVLYYSTLSEKYLYCTISGFHGVVAGFLVGIKQLMADQEIALLYVLKFRAKWLPSIAVLLSTIITSSFGGTVGYLPFIISGTYTSWVYLRFYQVKSDASLRGDPSEEFAFTTFFPEFLRPVVGILSTVFWKLFCGRRASPSTTDQSDPSNPLPGSDPAEAIRRRERGARALEERLSSAAAGSIGTDQVPLVAKAEVDGESGEAAV